MFTARATTSPRMASEMSECILIALFAQPGLGGCG